MRSRVTPANASNHGVQAEPWAKSAPEYWLSRVFRNSFTRHGKTFQVRSWSVKIQHLGARRTFTLSAPDRMGAAIEACELYRSLLAFGWGPVAHRNGGGASGATGLPDDASKLSAQYWKARLVVRKNTEWLGTGFSRELSVHIDHRGEGDHFPLATENIDHAARKALEIYRTVITKGWAQARLSFPRELTVSVFWNSNPFACTYTTVYTIPPSSAADGTARPEKSPPIRSRPVILLVEPDAGLRQALAFWLSRAGQVFCPHGRESSEERIGRIKELGPCLLMSNQNLADEWRRTLAEILRGAGSMIPCYQYGVFANSDQIFTSISGIQGGYLLRRRSPPQLLEPISRALQHAPFTPAEAATHIKRYFQGLFDTPARDRAGEIVSLTEREQQILDYLSKGCLDKEIATDLGISAWTVHTHLKKIFEKFHVHTRTEAVVRYLQK